MNNDRYKDGLKKTDYLKHSIDELLNNQQDVEDKKKKKDTNE